MEKAKEKKRNSGQDTEYEGRFLNAVRVGIAGLTPGAGATLFTVCAAGFLDETGSSVSVAELGDGGIYEALGMEKRFALREFCSFSKAAAGSANLRRIENREMGINWALKLPDERGTLLPYREALRLIYGIAGEVILYDFSGRKSEDVWLLAKEMDEMIVVADPLPQSLFAGLEALERWKLSELSVSYAVNRWAPGISKKELARFLKVREPVQIPFLAPQWLYEVQYAGVAPWSNPEIRESMRPALVELFRPIFAQRS